MVVKIAAVLALAAPAAVTTAQTVAPEVLADRAVIRIEVLQPAPYQNYSVTFTGPDCSDRPSRETCLARETSAEMRWPDKVPQVARSVTCPALSGAFAELAALPPLRRTSNGWEIAQAPPPAPRPGEPMPIPPTKKDGAAYRFTVQGRTADGEPVQMVLNDYDGDYGRWADGLWTLRDCWKPTS